MAISDEDAEEEDSEHVDKGKGIVTRGESGDDSSADFQPRQGATGGGSSSRRPAKPGKEHAGKDTADSDE